MDYIFAAGKFQPCSLFESQEKVKEAGYACSQVVGVDSGLHYTLFEHSEREDWIVAFGTAFRYTYISVEGWGDLIVLLAKLSSIVLPAMVEGNEFQKIFTAALERVEGSR